MSRSKAPIYIGTAVAGGLGYYLYSAGGSPKVAQKEFESEHPPFPIASHHSPPQTATNTPLPPGDAHKAAAKIRGEIGHPTQQTNYEKEGKHLGQSVGAKFDSAVRPPPPYPYLPYKNTDRPTGQHNRQGPLQGQARDRVVRQERKGRDAQKD